MSGLRKRWCRRAPGTSNQGFSRVNRDRICAARFRCGNGGPCRRSTSGRPPQLGRAAEKSAGILDASSTRFPHAQVPDVFRLTAIAGAMATSARVRANSVSALDLRRGDVLRGQRAIRWPSCTASTPSVQWRPVLRAQPATTQTCPRAGDGPHPGPRRHAAHVRFGQRPATAWRSAAPMPRLPSMRAGAWCNSSRSHGARVPAGSLPAARPMRQRLCARDGEASIRARRPSSALIETRGAANHLRRGDFFDGRRASLRSRCHPMAGGTLRAWLARRGPGRARPTNCITRWSAA